MLIDIEIKILNPIEIKYVAMHHRYEEILAEVKFEIKLNYNRKIDIYFETNICKDKDSGKYYINYPLMRINGNYPKVEEILDKIVEIEFKDSYFSLSKENENGTIPQKILEIYKDNIEMLSKKSNEFYPSKFRFYKYGLYISE